MRLSIIIPAYNEAKYLPDCLRAIQREIQRNAADQQVEVLVIDNASTDGTSEVARSFTGVRVVREQEKGLTWARQKALDSAHGEVLAFVDADTRMPQGWITKVMGMFAADSQVVCVSGPYIYYDGSSIQRACVRLYWLLLAIPAYQMTRYMAVGGNFAARKDALMKIGGFDVGIAFYGEDTNIARRLASAGKVKFHLGLPMYTSARRLHDEGMWRMALKYGANFLSEVVLKRPLTRAYRDVR